MTLVVETGEGLASAESYLSAADFRSRAAALGLGYLNPSDTTGTWITSASDADVESALRRGSYYVDSLGGDKWLGVQMSWQQALAWPRARVVVYGAGAALAPIMYSAGGYGRHRRSYAYAGVRAALDGVGGFGGVGATLLPSDAIPPRVLLAATLASVRELYAPGALQPDGAGDGVTSETVGPISVDYAVGTRGARPSIPSINDALKPLMVAGGGSVFPLGRS